MTIGIGILLIAVGAILKFAINDTLAGVSLETVGVILMIAGAVAALLALIRDMALFSGFRRDRAIEEERIHRGAV